MEAASGGCLGQEAYMRAVCGRGGGGRAACPWERPGAAGGSAGKRTSELRLQRLHLRFPHRGLLQRHSAEQQRRARAVGCGGLREEGHGGGRAVLPRPRRRSQGLRLQLQFGSDLASCACACSPKL
jgi:hypothetical protein